jgi:hypothetical protein
VSQKLFRRPANLAADAVRTYRLRQQASELAQLRGELARSESDLTFLRESREHMERTMRDAGAAAGRAAAAALAPLSTPINIAARAAEMREDTAPAGEDAFHCAICLEDRDPQWRVALRCGHTMCVGCLHRMVQQMPSLQCPTCRVNFTQNQVLLRMFL